ncbi:protein Wnt-8b-like [Oppia nitens]|uniref:protein Wnt-8b-like n=1 Tax=Oppia nitens TaxID=1686743 RepID=UPI0023DCADA0|nr:protein Wnt-8b-like [Oppia nitens]
MMMMMLLCLMGWSIGNLLLVGSQAAHSSTDITHFTLGAEIALNECLRQFSFERWTCPESTFKIVTDQSTAQLPANREIAFIQAIISAGIVYTVTRNCSLGQLDSCRCLTQQQRGGGGRHHRQQQISQELADKTFKVDDSCKGSIDEGSRISKIFLDDRETGHDFKAIVRLHNHEVGRYAVRETMIKTCKCHGMSGSCTMQTCWLRINSFEAVGDYLKRAYKLAIKVNSNHNSNHNHNRLNLTRLAFTEESPDYCVANQTLGSNGTLGRYCSKRRARDVSKEEKKSCRRLCTDCGHKIRRQRRRVITSCNCKFKYCCEVECQSCAKEQFQFVCIAKH